MRTADRFDLAIPSSESESSTTFRRYYQRLELHTLTIMAGSIDSSLTDVDSKEYIAMLTCPWTLLQTLRYSRQQRNVSGPFQLNSPKRGLSTKRPQRAVKSCMQHKSACLKEDSEVLSLPGTSILRPCKRPAVDIASGYTG